uniref:Transposase n=1 Tax=Heterorhabditis bacteriophora TaxID=37862 RepID=A0A1I7X960_HETBA
MITMECDTVHDYVFGIEGIRIISQGYATTALLFFCLLIKLSRELNKSTIHIYKSFATRKRKLIRSQYCSRFGFMALQMVMTFNIPRIKN